MASRYQELFRLQPRLYIEGSPVIIEAGALQKDSSTNKVLAQIKLRNLAPKNIIACKVTLCAYEPNGNEVEGIASFSYLDINVALGKEFGAKTPIYLPDNTTRRFSVAVTEVVFADNTIWNSESTEWTPIPAQWTVAEKFRDAETVRQYQLEAGNDCGFIPEISCGLFLCTCGSANLATAERCYRCNRKYENLIRILDEESLFAKRDARLKREQEEKEAVERAAAQAFEEARLKEEAKRRKTKKILKIVIPIVIVIAIIAALTPGVIKPAVDNAIAYHNASGLLASGSYDEAKAAFEALGDYRDSADQALESQYQKADMYNSEQKYAEAIELWSSLGNYSDSKTRIETAEFDWKEADYQSAITLMDSQKYAEASEAFDNLEGYRDSTEKSAECLALKKEADYQAAVASVSDGDFNNAIKGFKKLSGYKDSDELYTSTAYTYACQLLDNKDYANAIAQFAKCSGYKDADSKLLDAEYGYVIEHKDRAYEMTYMYLNDLIAANYSDALSIYNELYAWKVEITAINNSENGTNNMPSVSRYDRIYFHFKVTGGAPYVVEDAVVKTQLPGCKASFGSAVLVDGRESWYSTAYASGASAGTCSITFYNSKGNVIAYGSIQLT